MRQVIIYLAGCKGDWRERAMERWAGRKDVFPIDPFKENQLCISEFTQGDLEDLTRADYVLAYHGYHVFDGLALECGYAYALTIPIVYVCTQPRVSSMIAGVSKAVFTELEPALEYLERMIDDGQKQEQEEGEPDSEDPRPFYGPFGGVPKEYP